MFAQFGDIAPKALLAGTVIWAAVNWAYLGPELGARTLRADGHVESCEHGYGESVAALSRDAVEAVEVPMIDAQREIAARVAREQLNGPMGQLLRATGQDRMLIEVLNTYEREKKEVQAAYERAVASAKEKTTAKLGKAGDYCGCVADEAISSAQTDFAIYSGTLTLFKPAGIRDLDALMKRSAAGDACTHTIG